MKCPCETYKEREAIKVIDGGIEPDQARKQARFETCKGCPKPLGIGLFDNLEEID